MLQKTKIPEQKAGPWRIERFTVGPEQAARFNVQMACRGIPERRVKPGTYTRLLRRGTRNPIMSDTPQELADHEAVVNAAHGRCLVAGLGLGVVVEAMLRKPEVEHVTVVELSEHVIDMTGDYLLAKWGPERLEIVMDDIMTWQYPANAYWKVGWFDIWDDITRQNLDDVGLLKRRFRRRADWRGFWAEAECREEKRKHDNWLKSVPRIV